MEDSVPMSLEHLGVRIETRVAELGDLLCKEFDSVGRVAEDDRLVDLELQDRKDGTRQLKKTIMDTGQRRDEPWRRGY